MEKQIKLFFIIFFILGAMADVAGIMAFVFSETTGGMIAFGIGMVFTAVGAIGLVVQRKKEEKLRFLMQTGKKLTAKVVRVEQNTSITFNGRNPLVLTCEARDGMAGKLLSFRSGNYWGNYYSLTGWDVDVYYDPRDTEQYAVDLKSLREPSH